LTLESQQELLKKRQAGKTDDHAGIEGFKARGIGGRRNSEGKGFLYRPSQLQRRAAARGNFQAEWPEEGVFGGKKAKNLRGNYVEGGETSTGRMETIAALKYPFG